MKRATRDEWKRRIDNWRASGMSARSYAQRNGFSQSALYRWSALFQPETATVKLAIVKTRPPAVLSDAECDVVLASQRPAENKPQPSVISDSSTDRSMDVVALNGRTVRIRPGFDPGLLTAVLSALEAST